MFSCGSRTSYHQLLDIILKQTMATRSNCFFTLIAIQRTPTIPSLCVCEPGKFITFDSFGGIWLVHLTVLKLAVHYDDSCITPWGKVGFPWQEGGGGTTCSFVTKGATWSWIDFHAATCHLPLSTTCHLPGKAINSAQTYSAVGLHQIENWPRPKSLRSKLLVELLVSGWLSVCLSIFLSLTIYIV